MIFRTAISISPKLACPIFERVAPFIFKVQKRRFWNMLEHFQVGVALAFVSSLMSKEVFPDAICSVLKATGTVHFIFISTLYFVKMLRLQITKSELRRQRFLFTAVGISVVLVAIPHSILLLNEWGIVTVSSVIRGKVRDYDYREHGDFM
uniref:Uncharacterized protein n=1 Tax=Parascaris equorum TaxID=6256 RepID=A0A914RDL6_PAREQ